MNILTMDIVFAGEYPAYLPCFRILNVNLGYETTVPGLGIAFFILLLQ